MAEKTTPKKKRGRPRKDGTKSANQREEIAAAAIDLFSRQGYAQTTLSGIARAAGLDQSSVYYWFSGKDDILRHLVEMNRSSLRIAEGIGAFPGQKAAQLYTVLYEDALMLCNLPFDFYILEEAARTQPDHFQDLFSDYHALVGKVRDIISDGVADGSFVACKAADEAVFALAVNEGAQHRFHWQGIANLSEELAPSQVARAAAEATLSRLLVNGKAEDVRAAALERGWVVS